MAVGLGKIRKKKAEDGELPSYQEIGKLGGEARARTMSGSDKKALASMGRQASKSGGAARAAALSPERRREIALKANAKRWGSEGKG